MPPCAQTECDRFTGTIEKRSTCPPISAILMTAESPANPPPTTIILGAAILECPLSVACCWRPRLLAGLCYCSVLIFIRSQSPRSERCETRQANRAKQQEKCQAELQ